MVFVVVLLNGGIHNGVEDVHHIQGKLQLECIEIGDEWRVQGEGEFDGKSEGGESTLAAIR